MRRHRTAAANAGVLHADETSIRVNRKKHWIHSCSGGDLVVKHCHPKRGAQALDDINIIPRYGDRGDADDEPHQKPVLVHDRWAAYFKYKHCDHSLCGPHLLRNLKYIEKANAHDWAIKMRRLLLDTCKEVSDADTKRLCAARFEKVSSKYTKILDDGKTELPPRPPRTGKRGRIPKSEAEKLHEAFVKFKNEILRFAERSEVPFSNNRAYADIGIVELNMTSAWPRCGKKSQAPIETSSTPTPTAESQATCSRCHCKATARSLPCKSP